MTDKLLSEYKEDHLRWLTEQDKIDREETVALVERLSKSQLVAAGLAIAGLYPVDYKTCFGGRISVVFDCEGKNLRKTAIKSGDLVSVENGTVEVNGTVHRITQDNVTVIFDSDPDLQGPVRLVKRGNPIVFERMINTLKELSLNHPIVNLILDPKVNEVELDPYCTPTILDKGLNREQERAVHRAVQARHLAIIHGPPGTGKTQCIAAIIRSMPRKRILLAAASNLAVDNMVERLLSGPKNNNRTVVRIGHPARLTESVLGVSLDSILAESDQGAIIRDIKRDIEKQLAILKGKYKKISSREIFKELKQLRFELKQREEKRLEELMTSKEGIVIATTLNGAASRTVKRYGPYDVCIIDEASQALQAESWIASTLAPKLIIVGDHHQLPPTTDVKGLKTTLFDLVIKKFPKEAIMLQRQYRMHKDIMQWSNNRFYLGKLIADESVAEEVIDDEVVAPVVFIDTAGEAMWDRVDTATGSHWNEHEADLVLEHVNKIMKRCNNIAIISPYSAQVDYISDLLVKANIANEHVQVGTVDGFQGREADAVILSLVRSNPQREFGFLSEPRRLNVAITRARRHLCIIGDSGTIRVGYRDLVEWLEGVAEVVSPNNNM